jgi:hypothetical protein
VKCSHVPVDGYVVVIENDDDVRLAGTGVVQPFERKSSCEGAVADECD